MFFGIILLCIVYYYLNSRNNEKKVEIVEENLDFIPSETFRGAKEGYVFKNGNMGIGYYIDNNVQLLYMSGESDTDHYSDASTDTDDSSSESESESDSDDSNSQPEPDEEKSDDEIAIVEEKEIDFQARRRRDYDTDLDSGDDRTWNWRNAENNRLITTYIKYHKQQDKKIKELNDRLSKLVATLIRTRFLPQNYYDATDAAAAVTEELSPPRASPRVFAAQPRARQGVVGGADDLGNCLGLVRL